MKKRLLFFVSIFASIVSFAQDYHFDLWEGTPPNNLETNVEEVWDTTNILRIKNVTQPTIDVFLPSKAIATGQAVVICPGGAYKILAYTKEGTDIAKWLNGKGIAAIVLKYRLPDPMFSEILHKSPLLDANRAIRITRFNAKKWNIDPDQIGIMGFSAGGHLASSAGTHYDLGIKDSKNDIDKTSCKPDFMVLVYPVISMDTAITHMGSRENLLGKKPDDKLIQNFSNELQVNQDTPPTFLIHSQDDRAVPVQNSLRFHAALMKNNVPAELHVFPNGGHGFGLGYGKDQVGEWISICHKWMENLAK